MPGSPPMSGVPADFKVRMLIGGIVLLFVSYAVFFNITQIYNPVRNVESFLLAALWTCPFWGALGIQRVNLVEVVPRESYTPIVWLGTVITWAALIFLSVSGVYYLNGIWDTTPKKSYSIVAMGKERLAFDEGPAFYASVPAFTPSKLEVLELAPERMPDRTVHFRIDEHFEQFYLGYSRIGVLVGGGHFGLPWVMSYSWDNPPKPERKPRDYNTNYWLGLRYFEGTNNMPKDDVKAVEYFRIAAQLGDADAQHDLAYMYSNGLGGLKQDWVKANELLMQAAKQGNAAAQDDLGVSYGDGRGIDQDWVQSYVWIERAARQGYVQAIKDIEYAKAHMTPEQIDRAKALSEEPIP